MCSKSGARVSTLARGQMKHAHGLTSDAWNAGALVVLQYTCLYPISVLKLIAILSDQSLTCHGFNHS